MLVLKCKVHEPLRVYRDGEYYGEVVLLPGGRIGFSLPRELTVLRPGVEYEEDDGRHR